MYNNFVKPLLQPLKKCELKAWKFDDVSLKTFENKQINRTKIKILYIMRIE